MLRNRILLGVAPLILLLMVVGGYAVWLFVRLGSAVNTTLHENYTSIVAMRDLREHALRIDQALLAYRAGQATLPQTRSLLEQQAAFCRGNVGTEAAIITEVGERAAADQLKRQDEALLTAANDALAQQGDSAGNGLQPALGNLLEAAQTVVGINERAMTQKDHRARDTARQSTRIMLLAIAAAVPLGVYFAYRLSGIVLRPIRRLTESARELGEGNLDQVLPVSSPDELGELAGAFNKMAGKLRVYRQTTSEELVHARQATESVFAALLDPIIIFSAEGEIAYQNPASERLRKKLAGTETTLPVVPLAMKVIQGGGDFLPESFDQSICVRVDDREKFLLPRVIGLRDGGAGAVVILHDITRFRLLDDVKTNLVATVSHELKTPLTSIRMAVYLLLEERIGALNPKQTELLIASRDDAERLLDLINNLLDLAKLESGTSVSDRRAQRPQDLMRHAVEDSRELASAAGTQLVMQVGANLPPVTVSADQLGHVFANLFSNAIKHSPPGEEIVLAARAENAGRAVRFGVIDHGPGVPAAERERVFEKFYRLPGEPREGAGPGAGDLPGNRPLARRPDRGRRGPGRPGERVFLHPTRRPPRTRPNPHPSMSNGKIFIIDDERTIRLTFRLALETDGYEVQEAASAEEAVKGFQTQKFDLVVLDLRLGEDSGLDVLAAMRQRGIQTPTVMITAYGSIRNAVRAMQLGAIDFLEKPIEPVALRQLVGEVVGRHRATPERVELGSTEDFLREAKRLINLQSFELAGRMVAEALSFDERSADRAQTCKACCTRSAGTTTPPRKSYGRAIKLDARHPAAPAETCGASSTCSTSGAAKNPSTSGRNADRPRERPTRGADPRDETNPL